ncbi:hypothetical protein [Sphingopyxis macrogoltabida]|uniref:Uncharacterized protein n=1 Tax=Sphingopyxis macrogoltabida TaxID=33050 RepID=A0AAC8YWI2_SPHMC|nr:hypothetical protein [Sphingopyxis macrogoltabida]ALJ11249.1 hypothetical protein LH19_00065 [Sphingopyxis macrogoltabida]AMU87446.1 hypothetical protein ATM17_00065 [Sphingopyxis macrogoltabida]
MYSKIFASAVVAATLTTAACAASPPARHWEIGPVIRGKNYSQGMPRNPEPAHNGWSFDFPAPDAAAGHVHYVTFRPGPIAGKSRIVVRYRVDAAPDTRFVPQETPDVPATVSVYFQRRGDNWNGQGSFQYYRWYAPSATVRRIAPGEQEVSIRFDDPNWTSVNGRKPASAPGAIDDALADIDRIGLVFGSSGRRGHGVFATAPARFTLLSFQIL